MNDTSEARQVSRVESSPTKDPAVRLFIFAAMLLGMGLYCFYDQGKYPYVDPADDLNGYLTYAFNHYGPFVAIPPGIVAAIWGVLFLRRKLVADEKGIGVADKGQIAWEDFNRLDASKLKSKGILYLYYGDGRKLTLDSWKLKNFRELIEFVESHIPPQLRPQ